MLRAVEAVCGWTKGRQRHLRTLGWNTDTRRAWKEKLKWERKFRQSGADEDRRQFGHASRKAKKVERREFHKEIQKLVKDLNKEVGRRKLFKIARRMANGQNKMTGPIGLKRGGQLVTDKDEIKKIWMEYMEKLLNEENDWDGECS